MHVICANWPFNTAACKLLLNYCIAKLTAECKDEQETHDGDDNVTLNEHLTADVVKCNRGVVTSSLGGAVTTLKPAVGRLWLTDWPLTGQPEAWRSGHSAPSGLELQWENKVFGRTPMLRLG